MKRSPKTLRNFLLLVFSIVFLQPIPLFAVDVNPISMAVSGDVTARWIMGSAYRYAPYHSAFVLDLMSQIHVNPNLSVDYMLRIENPSLSNGYGKLQRISGRGTIISTYHNWTLRVGDLRKITLGNGLLIKDFESEGFDLRGPLGAAWEGGITYVAHGYSEPGDYAIFSAKKERWGIYLFSYIDDSAYFRAYANVAGIYATWELLPLLNIRTEISYPLGVQVSPRVHYSDGTNTYTIALTGRYYSKALNSPFQQFVFSKPYHGIEEEVEDFDNWRNYLLSTLSDPQDIKGLSIRVAGEQHIWGGIWIYGDSELCRQYLLPGHIDTALYAFGVQMRLESQQQLYLGIQNRILNSLGVAEYQNRDPPPYDRDTFSDINSPVLVQVAPYVVMGTTIRF